MTSIEEGDSNLDTRYCLVIEKSTVYRPEVQEEYDTTSLFKLHFFNNIIQAEKYLSSLTKAEMEYLLFRFTTAQVFSVRMLPYCTRDNSEQYISWNDYFNKTTLKKYKVTAYGIDFEKRRRRNLI